MSALRPIAVLAGICIATLLAARTSDLPLQDAAVEHPHPSGEHHEHGDGDDRHDSPDSPCHHHDEHCPCSASMELPGLSADAAGTAAEAPGMSVDPLASGRHALLLPTDIFHPPLA
mgnify:CR=1 FL=1